MSFFTRDWFVNKLSANTWTTSLKNVPEKYCHEQLKKYLVESREKTFDKDSLRAFKSLKAFKYFKDGYVQKLKTATVKDDAVSPDSIFLCKAQVMASMARKHYTVFTCISSSSGLVLGGSCECVAGKGEACNHVAAVLFALDDFVSEGLNNVPDDVTCTDRLKQWNKPSERVVQAKTVADIKVHKPKFGSKERPKMTKTDPRHPADRTVNSEARKQLFDSIKKILPQCGFGKYGVPKVSASILSESPSKSTISTHFINVHPPSLKDIKDACEDFKKKLHVSDEDIKEIDSKTMSQSKSALWHQVRSVRITASNFHSVVKRRSTTNPTCLLKKLLGYGSSVKKAAMKFGLDAEGQAIERYLADLQNKTGNRCLAKEVGFRIHKEHPFLGASADRILEDPVRGMVVIELKNPLSTWDKTIHEACKVLPCLKFDENAQVTLNRKHAYYTQVIGQMAVYGISLCDFVLCTKNEIFVETVDFDEDLWMEYLPKLEYFYNNAVLPEIVYPSVIYGNEPLVLE
ncbi:uncharacterized protein LOC117320144 [Pecten maximus]|uniref:uncharacterized protein LOC117320144 n=1 Tax=Pecten maximus TaxID=6579 RepID=UPI0014584ABE|nr:uncharacterized protein LOC117320144 [Pecten maximus]